MDCDTCLQEQSLILISVLKPSGMMSTSGPSLPYFWRDNFRPRRSLQLAAYKKRASQWLEASWGVFLGLDRLHLAQ